MSFNYFGKLTISFLWITNFYNFVVNSTV